jgi:hypothetical protein
MRKTLYALALAAPLAALAAPADRPAAPRGGPDAAGFDEGSARMEKRMRLARTLGLAEALDLSEAEAIRMRDVLARFDEKREPLRKQVGEARQTLRKAARGDAAAQKGVDDALKRLRDLRGQMFALRDELFQAITKDLTPERKARAALFMERFRERMGGKMGEVRERVRELRFRRDPGGPGGMGPGGPGGMGPGGPGGMGGPGMMGPGPGMGMQDLPEPPAFAEGPDLDDDEPI